MNLIATKYLSWRDIVVLEQCCYTRVRKLLSSSDLQKICRRLNSRENLNRKIWQSLDFDFLRTASPDQFMNELLLLVRNVRSKRMVHKNKLLKNVIRYPAVNLLCNTSLIDRRYDSTTRFNGLVFQTSIHPALRIAAVSFLEEKGLFSTITSITSLLRIFFFGKTSQGENPNIPKRELYAGHLEEFSTAKGIVVSNQKELYPEWSPCGRLLSVVERNPFYNGLHARAQVRLFALENDGDFYYLRPLDDVVISVSAYSISNHLWLKEATLLLPDSANNGGNPSVLTVDVDQKRCTLQTSQSKASEPHRETPGLLTALSCGWSCFVRYCEKIDVPLSSRHTYLGGHEHHVITVLDDCQKPSFEIVVPGLVIEITSSDDLLCFTFRNHVAIQFETSIPVVIPPTPATTSGSENTSCNSDQLCGVFSRKVAKESLPRQCIRYESLSALHSPFYKKTISRPTDDSKCPIKMVSAKSTRYIPHTFLETASHFSKQFSQDFYVADHPEVDSPVINYETEEETESETDDSDQEPHSKKPRPTPPKLPYAGFTADACEGRFYAPVCRQLDHKFYYAEINVKTASLNLFSENRLNDVNFRDRSFGVGAAYEAFDDPPGNSTKCNRVMLLSKHAKNNNLKVNSSCAYINLKSLKTHGTRETVVLSRNHANLPVLRSEGRSQFLTIENKQSWITYSNDKYDNFRGLEIRTSMPGKDERKAACPDHPLPWFVPFAYEHNAQQ